MSMYEDRTYKGDMFADKKPIRLEGKLLKPAGEPNPALGTRDYALVTIWSTSGTSMRFVRLKEAVVRIPPLAVDQRFRVGHSAKSIYYAGSVSGEKKLVVVFLEDLSHTVFDLKDGAATLETLEDSSLVQHYLCF